MGNFRKFREYLSLRMASFWKFWVYKSQPQGKKNKEKAVESRDIQLMFLSRSTERQVGHDGKTVAIDWFWKKPELAKKFCAFFCELIFAKYEFSPCLACIYFRDCLLKENFACFNFAKSTKLPEIYENTYTRKLVRLR